MGQAGNAGIKISTMKKLFVLSLTLLACYVVNAQKQFSDKQEAYAWLQNAFAKYFIKSKVSLAKTADILKYQDYVFDYSFNENYLLISYNEEDALSKKNYHFLLIPFAKVSEVTIGETTPYFNQSTHIAISSQCRCFKQTDGKKFKGEDNADYLKQIEILPFNVNDEPEIGTSLKNAFAVLSGNQSQQVQGSISKASVPVPASTDKFILRVNADDIKKAKEAYKGIVIPNEKSDLQTLGLHGKVRSVKTTYNDVVKDSAGSETLKLNYSTFSIYSSNGRLVSTVTTQSDGSTSRRINIYSDKEMLLYTLNPEDSIASIKCTYAKLANGDLIKDVIAGFSGSLYTYRYLNGELVSLKKEQEDPTKSELIKFKTKYDNFKNVLSQDGYLNDALKEHFQYSYNAKNLMTSAEYDSDGEFLTRNTMKYNDKNNLVETSYTYKNTSISTNKYEQFDENGNSTKYKTYRDGNLQQVVSREIDYY